MTDKRTLEARLTRHYVAAGSPSSWYRESRREARAMARANGVTTAVAAGVIAALSPRQQWSTNLRNARTLLATGTCPGFATQVVKAARIRSGERPLSVLSGPKERSFYRAIMGDEDAVTIDVWMARAFGIDPGQVARLYEVLVKIVRKVASAFGVGAATLQAAVWTQVRGRAN